jgi:hypothetical protein
MRLYGENYDTFGRPLKGRDTKQAGFRDVLAQSGAVWSLLPDFQAWALDAPVQSLRDVNTTIIASQSDSAKRPVSILCR